VLLPAQSVQAATALREHVWSITQPVHEEWCRRANASSAGRTPVDTETFLTIRQAADVCQVSIDTIRRRLRTNAIPGAERSGPNETDGWLIPIAGLRAAGFKPDQAHRADRDGAVNALREERTLLRAQLDAEKRRGNALEAIIERQDREIARLERILEAVLPGKAA
jgi:hypothetical protein